eukprot:159842_1
MGNCTGTNEDRTHKAQINTENRKNHSVKTDTMQPLLESMNENQQKMTELLTKMTEMQLNNEKIRRENTTNNVTEFKDEEKKYINIQSNYSESKLQHHRSHINLVKIEIRFKKRNIHWEYKGAHPSFLSLRNTVLNQFHITNFWMCYINDKVEKNKAQIYDDIDLFQAMNYARYENKNELKIFVNEYKNDQIPLNQFKVNNVCEKIAKWVYNDCDYKKQAEHTARIFAIHELTGHKMMILTANDAKNIVKEELLEYITCGTIDKMFSAFKEWKHTYPSNIASKTAEEIAYFVFHHPLNQLIKWLRKEEVDGNKFINHIDKDVTDIQRITGWTLEFVEQIQLLLLNHIALTNEEFQENISYIFSDKKNDEQSLPNEIVQQINRIILENFDDETGEKLQYSIKNNRSNQITNSFLDHITTMILEIDSNQNENKNENEESGNYIQILYNKAIPKNEEMMFLKKKEWVCSKCTNYNFIAYINIYEIDHDLRECSLCGTKHIESIIFRMRNHKTKNDDAKEEKNDEIENYMNTVINEHSIDVSCPNAVNNKICPFIKRLAKVLWNYNVVQKRLQESQKLDKALENNVFTKIFNFVIETNSQIQQATKQILLSFLTDNMSDMETFLSSNRKQFVKEIKQYSENRTKTIKANVSGKIFDEIHRYLSFYSAFLPFSCGLNEEQIEADFQHINMCHIMNNKENVFDFFQKFVHFADTTSVAKNIQSKITKQETKDLPFLSDKQDAMRQRIKILYLHLTYPKVKPKQTEEIDKFVSVSHGCDYRFGINYEHYQMNHIFSSISQEIIGTDRSRLTKTQFQMELTKAKIIVQNYNTLKKYNLFCNQYDKPYQIIRNQQIGIRHILSIVVYTDIGSFCKAFRQTYRHLTETEPPQKVEKRHRNLYRYARALFEAIHFFGTYMDPEMTVFHGVSLRAKFTKFRAYFNQPISTTSSIQSAQLFTAGVGIILSLKCATDAPNVPKYLPVEWMSDFPYEKEKLFYTRNAVFKICNIHSHDTRKWTSHEKKLSAFMKFQRILENEKIIWKDNYTAAQLEQLISHKCQLKEQFEAKSDEKSYIQNLFNHFCDNMDIIKFNANNYNTLPLKLKTLL